MSEPHLDRRSHQMLIDAATKASTEEFACVFETIAETAAITEAVAIKAHHQMQRHNNDIEAKLRQLEIDHEALQVLKKIQGERLIEANKKISDLNVALKQRNKEVEDMPKNHRVDLHEKDDINEELQNKLQKKNDEIKNLKERVVDLEMASARATQPQHSSIAVSSNYTLLHWICLIICSP
jgi:chromosome segregation ATPase